MGIPKFYRWISERYPLVNQPVAQYSAPEVDNLYLDMNGIVHNCTHGNDPSKILTQEEMTLKIFNYTEKLFQIVRPQKLLYMAIDGVAPRAKMNQQRARRFKTAVEREEAKKEAMRQGQMSFSDFDSNCITPGTEFMGILGDNLQFFVRHKIATDPAWQNVEVILSAHDVPGEGEHKIMEYIREWRSSPKYVPNTRHCLYGLDADLIMLGLVTHETHFCLLREVVDYKRNQGQPARDALENPTASKFVIFQVCLLREYLDLEFRNDVLDWFDIERVIDDLILLCMLVGNDFLPTMPTLDINEGALNSIFALYKTMLPTLNGYITHNGAFDPQGGLGRFEALCERLAKKEAETLKQRAEDAQYFEAKKKRNKREVEVEEIDGELLQEALVALDGDEGAQEEARQQFKQAQTKSTWHVVPGAEDAGSSQPQAEGGSGGGGDGGGGGVQTSNAFDVLVNTDRQSKGQENGCGGEGDKWDKSLVSEPTMMSKAARKLFAEGNSQKALVQWKERYYCVKLGYKPEAIDEAKKGLIQEYITGLSWVLAYYYQGVASWTWFFPEHYAPMCSDMVGLDSVTVTFDYGQPFLPFQQLMSVLPTASSALVPTAYRHLMTSSDSPIADFYPADFAIDSEGKRQEWEAVILIPFIDETRLLSAMASIPSSSITSAEHARNVQSGAKSFVFNPDAPDMTHLRAPFKGMVDIDNVNSTMVTLPANLTPPSATSPVFEATTTPGGVVQDAPSPALQRSGFPSFSTLKPTGALKRLGVTVLGSRSRRESLALCFAPGGGGGMGAGEGVGYG